MPSPATIRHAQESDANGLAALWLELGRHLVELNSSAFKVPELPGLAEWFRTVLATSRSDESGTFVAEVDGAVAGMVSVRLVPPMKDAPRQVLQDVGVVRAEIDALAVLERFRRHGIGRLLMEAAERWGREHGASLFFLDTYVMSPLSVPFYERLGYARRSIRFVKPQEYGVAAGVIVGEGALSIRRMRDEPGEFERMARWRNQPHVREWWDPDEPPLSSEAARNEYGPDTRGEALTAVCVIEFDRRPVGFLQFYRWASFADEAQTIGIPFDRDTWGLDIFIGEPDRIGQGLGSAAVDLLCRHLLERGATAVALVAAKENARALHAYEKAGFRRDASVLDLDTRHGRRVESWLMVRRRDS